MDRELRGLRGALGPGARRPRQVCEPHGLGMLPRDKVETEMDYLQIAIDKTAGPLEQEAWDWLYAAVQDFFACKPEAR